MAGESPAVAAAAAQAASALLTAGQLVAEEMNISTNSGRLGFTVAKGGSSNSAGRENMRPSRRRPAAVAVQYKKQQ